MDIEMQNLLITFIEDSKNIIWRLEAEFFVNSNNSDYPLEQLKADTEEIEFRKSLLDYANFILKDKKEIEDII